MGNSKENSVLKVKGTITKNLPGAKFTVVANDYPMEMTCSLSGKMRKNKIKLVEGDSVEVELSPYDLTTGRISWRF